MIERDSVTERQARGQLCCTTATVCLETVPFHWVHAWAERLDASGVAFRFYHVPSITRTPVFVCELNDFVKEAAPYRVIHGRGCHPVPEIALFKAFAEAAQARVTYIAGAREDLVPAEYSPAAAEVVKLGFGLPLPSGMAGVDWSTIDAGPSGPVETTAALAAAGYDQVAAIELAKFDGISVVRAFVCGLGSLDRRRRNPFC